MKKIFNTIRNSEFLSFSEVLRLKVSIVTLFVVFMTILAIPLSSFNAFEIQADVVVPLVILAFIFITILFLAVNLNRLAMHFSVLTIVILLVYFTYGSNQFYGYIIFFVTLTILIFYQDIATYFVYGFIVTAYGVYYVFVNGDMIIGTNSLDSTVSLYSYIIILTGFYLIFLLQLLLSDNIYENMNSEWVRMTKLLNRYQSTSSHHLYELLEKNGKEPLYKNIKFQQTVSELSVFINEFFEEEANNIAEVVEYYFFIHNQEIDDVIGNGDLSTQARKYAVQLKKYLMNNDSELVSILYDFATLFKSEKKYKDNRYLYNLDELFPDKIDKLLSLAILYKYLKTELTQMDKWGMISKALTHQEITKMFISKEFREFITYEQVNFYLDNEDLFETYL
jgi:hypothetical protein